MIPPRLFREHGDFCASHPWEVIVALLALTICMMTGGFGDQSSGPSESSSATVGQQCRGSQCDGSGTEAVDIICMTIIRVSAVLYCYYQFDKFRKIGSKYILGITAIFILFSSFIFTSAIINFLGKDIADLKDALFFFILLIDLSKAVILAQLAMSGSNQEEVKKNIARGMELLGPTISLDTMVESLVIGVGTLSGAPRLEVVCAFGVMSVLVNYIVFMTFYPACLSLIMDLSRNSSETISKVKSKASIGESIFVKALTEENHKSNPVVQRVKVIMSTGLLIVHLYSRFVFSDKGSDDKPTDNLITPTKYDFILDQNKTEAESNYPIADFILKWLTISADQIVIVILLIALLVKFIFFENHEDLADRLRNVSSETIKESNTIAVNTAPMEELVHNERVKIDIVQTEDKVTQTMSEMISDDTSLDEPKNILDESLIEEMDRPPRSLDECIAVFNSDSIVTLTDDELILIINNGGGICPLYKLETILGDYERAVQIRRKIFAQQAKVNMVKMSNLSYRKFDYTKVMNTCCENVLGYVEIPVGYAGPLKLDGQIYYVPMATTEGALVASTNRGCKALSIMGVSSFVEDVGMTRAPCVRFASIMRAAQAKTWVETPANFEKIKVAFDATSRFARLQDIQVAIDGPQLYLRFRALTGDAMGMNMISKGTEMSLRFIHEHFPDMQIISLSGNFCSDKKPAAINWIRGRGKRVVCECIIPKDKLRAIFKTDVKTLVQCNKLKNLSGSAMAGSIGGNNAHAANMVTAIFIATGQDPAQNVTSSNCSTGMEPHGDTGEDLYITCTMPSLEVGTVGGGTGLPGQSTCLEILGVRGAHPIKPAQNSQQLARIICATVMAGELSLMAALVNNELVKSHMRHNRSSTTVNPNIEGPKLLGNLK